MISWRLRNCLGQPLEKDSLTGFLYFGKRYYDLTTFCWLTTDPIEDSDGPNLYAYLHNNPLYYTDPDGRFAFVVVFAIPLGWGALEAALASLTLKAVVATAVGTALGVAVYQGTHQLDICLNKSEDEQKRKERNKMRFNLNLNDYKNWDGENFSLYDYIYQTITKKKISSDVFFAFLELFWPRFLVYKEYIFLEDHFSKCHLKQLENSKDSNIEYWMNLITVDSYFENDADGEEKAQAFSKTLVEIWKTKLSLEFPDFQIVVQQAKDKETGDYGLTFYQSKNAPGSDARLVPTIKVFEKMLQ